MHGLAWMEETLGEITTVAEHCGLRTITKVTLCRGQLSHHFPEELELAWDLVKQGTICEQAVLVIEEEPALVSCSACGWEGQWHSELACCQACASRVELVSGTDLQLVDIQGI
ncbi:MAG: hydrogenase maturation nickel metallochaperone HypA [Firmicutes bacterium]|nr:hydrogenase maturation nickel metallochaperone HypA [Bacillota bacterium]